MKRQKTISTRLKNKTISTRLKNKTVADILGVSIKTARKINRYSAKDFSLSKELVDNAKEGDLMGLARTGTTNKFIPNIATAKDSMLDAIESGIMTWLDFYHNVSKVAQTDKLYSLPGIPENTDEEKIEITKMRTFLYYFYRHGYWNTAATCDYIGVSIIEVKDWTLKHHSFKEALQAIISVRHDYAESQLLKQMDGTGMSAVTATIFYLRTMGKERGWGEEMNINHGSRANMSKEQIDRMAAEYRKRMMSAKPANAQGGTVMQVSDPVAVATDQSISSEDEVNPPIYNDSLDDELKELGISRTDIFDATGKMVSTILNKDDGFEEI